MSKPGSGGVASASDSAISRRERLRELTSDGFDLANDPYLMKNHLGSYECRLCLTLHTNESSYLIHTQGKKHQENLARRALKLNREKQQQQHRQLIQTEKKKKIPVAAPRIGRPGYKIVKQYCRSSHQLSILFQLEYPLLPSSTQPRHRFMSSYEQKVVLPPNPSHQYLLVAAEPYEVVAFAIPNIEIERHDREKFFTHWDEESKRFTLQLFLNPKDRDQWIRQEKEKEKQKLEKKGEQKRMEMETETEMEIEEMETEAETETDEEKVKEEKREDEEETRDG